VGTQQSESGIKNGMVPKHLCRKRVEVINVAFSEKEKKKEILGYISKRARKDAAIYREVKENIESKTGKNIALRTVRRLGKELKASSKKTKRKSPSEGKVSWLFLFHFFV